MSQFTENISIAPLPKKNKWTTIQGFRFYVYRLGIGDYIDIPAGFEFDGCSIPICIFGAKVSPKTINSCALHDYLFKKKIYGYHFSNWIFYKSLRINNVGLFKSLRYLFGVTIGGWVSYYQIVDKISVAVKRRLKLSEYLSDKFR